MPHCPLEMRASAKDNEMGAEYFSKNKSEIRKELLKYGAIWFRGFDLMKSVSGYREMHEALGLDPCLDPLHSSGLRKFTSERDALYEEVRKKVYSLRTCWKKDNVSLCDCIARLTSRPSVVITLVCIANLRPSARLPMLLSSVSKKPPKAVVDS